MARFIEQGKSIFIPFRNGLSITDSQLHLRMYKSVKMFERYGYTCGEVDMLCEYAPVVRCKDCKKWFRHTEVDRERGECRRYETTKHETGYCDRGERKDNVL